MVFAADEGFIDLVFWLLPIVCFWLDCFLEIDCCLVYCKLFKAVLGSFLHFVGLISWLSLFLLDSFIFKFGVEGCHGELFTTCLDVPHY